MTAHLDLSKLKSYAERFHEVWCSFIAFMMNNDDDEEEEERRRRGGGGGGGGGGRVR
jgi:hypothetical protein